MKNKLTYSDIFIDDKFFFIDSCSYGLALRYNNLEECGNFVIEVNLVKQMNNRKCTVSLSKYNKNFTLLFGLGIIHFYCSGNYTPQMSINKSDIIYASSYEEALRIARDELGYSELIR